MEVTIEQVKSKTVVRRKWSQYLVRVGNTVVGLLEKFKDTRTEKNPWKAFKGYGQECTYIGAFYKKDGGKQGAILAVLHAAGLCPCGEHHA